MFRQINKLKFIYLLTQIKNLSSNLSYNLNRFLDVYFYKLHLNKSLFIFSESKEARKYKKIKNILKKVKNKSFQKFYFHFFKLL